LKPIRVTVSGIVSDSPVGSLAQLRAGATSKPSNDALAHLVGIRARRRPVTISTTIARWENMLLENLSVPVDPKTGEALRFDATFVQATFVTNKRTVLRTSDVSGRRKIRAGNFVVVRVAGTITQATAPAANALLNTWRRLF
jgi:hypothetical protein